MKDRSRLLHFVIHLIHPIPNFLLSFHLNTFYFFFSSISTLLARFKILQNPWKSFDANSINRARSFINPRNYPFNRVATGSPQGGCVRSLEAQTASRLAARDRVDKKQPGKGLEDGASTTRIPLGGDESQPSCYLPVRNGDRRELGQGKTTLNPRYQPPGAISARPSSRVSPFSSTPSFDNTVIRRLLWSICLRPAD